MLSRVSQPWTMTTIEHVELLPFADRQGEVAKLLADEANFELFCRLRAALLPPAPHHWGASIEVFEPVDWSWVDLLAHLDLSREACSDRLWLSKMKRCLCPANVALWDQLRSRLGCPSDFDPVEPSRFAQSSSRLSQKNRQLQQKLQRTPVDIVELGGDNGADADDEIDVLDDAGSDWADEICTMDDGAARRGVPDHPPLVSSAPAHVAAENRQQSGSEELTNSKRANHPRPRSATSGSPPTRRKKLVLARPRRVEGATPCRRHSNNDNTFFSIQRASDTLFPPSRPHTPITDFSLDEALYQTRDPSSASGNVSPSPVAAAAAASPRSGGSSCRSSPRLRPVARLRGRFGSDFERSPQPVRQGAPA
jgi:hypothetical protein